MRVDCAWALYRKHGMWHVGAQQGRGKMRGWWMRTHVHRCRFMFGMLPAARLRRWDLLVLLCMVLLRSHQLWVASIDQWGEEQGRNK